MKTVLLLFTFLSTLTVSGQQSHQEWEVGYFAPYLSNRGVILGYSFGWEQRGAGAEVPRKNHHPWQLLTQWGYFTQLNVSQNILINPELVYRSNKREKGLFLSASVGAGYLLSFQNQVGTLNVGTGETVYDREVFNYFLPTLNVGMGFLPQKHLGFYLKTTYGSKLRFGDGDAAFFGVSTGLMIKLPSKK